MTKLLQNAIVFFALMAIGTTLSQDSIVKDSALSPFRKGRWLTGISGSINSDRNETGSNDEVSTSNEYSLNIIGGNFFKDRWLIGGIIQADRSDSEGITDISNETIFVGPLISHYFSDASRGSLFLSVSPGYTRYRDEIELLLVGEVTRELSEGSGFGILLNLGYSYVVFDRIAFDIGFGINQFWINVDRELMPDNTVVSDDIAIRNISLSFGFRVILDQLLR